jgi:hypothetical protein
MKYKLWFEDILTPIEKRFYLRTGNSFPYPFLFCTGSLCWNMDRAGLERLSSI